MDVEVQDELKRLRLELSLLKNYRYSYGGGPVRPKGAKPYTVFFDTTLSQPVWWDGIKWIQVSGSGSGTPGQDGVTPHIGINGNWFIGGKDTGVHAKGADGQQGPAGPAGPKGDSPTITLTSDVGVVSAVKNN